MAEIAIVVPGIMGSVLKLGDEVIWPGPLSSLVFEYKLMDQLMREDLVATDCIRKFFVASQYQCLVDDLETCGFHEADKTLVIAAYDWRKDNALSAETLARHIEAAVANHGDDCSISLIAHSMGGLVSRYYLESGLFNQRKGFGNVRRLVTLGTPHVGAALALPLVLGYEKRLFLSREQVKQVVQDPRYPAGYQLLPPKGEPFAWDGGADRQLNVLDIYDPAVAQRLGLQQANLESASRFRAALDKGRAPAHVRYFCFAGTRQTTATFVSLKAKAQGALESWKSEQEDGGDGTVPTWSSFLPGVQRLFVGGEHGTLYQDDGLRRALANVLGKPGRLAGVPPKLEVSLREKVVNPDAIVHVSITFPTGIAAFTGYLTIERAKIDSATGAVMALDPPEQVQRVEYKGLGLETMSLVFKAPHMRGVYQVAFRDEMNAAPSGIDELIVQST